jgi:hypothetical protein
LEARENLAHFAEISLKKRARIVEAAPQRTRIQAMA